MRTIKFRGKNPKGEWVIGDLLRNRGETFIAPPGIANPLATLEDFRVDPATVGQFTGLLDKNGREIYEGDIIECVGSASSPFIRHQVLFSPHKGCLCQYTLTKAAYLGDYEECGAIYQDYISKCGKYIIGNVHDTLELLNPKQS